MVRVCPRQNGLFEKSTTWPRSSAESITVGGVSREVDGYVGLASRTTHSQMLTA